MAVLKESSCFLLVAIIVVLNGVSGVPVKPEPSKLEIVVDGAELKPEFISESKTPDIPVTLIPNPDGLLHFYALPVGQGDSHVIQCPNGDLSIMDLGTSDGVAQGFWSTNQIVSFLNGHFHRIKNVIISHLHTDHYSMYANVLSTARDLSGLTNVYTSCTYASMPAALQNWLTAIGAVNKVRTFNGGAPCGPFRPVCGALNLCPGNAAVVTKVFGANLENCVGTNRNIDSVVFKVTYNQVSVFFNGDFEDSTSSETANGVQKAMVDYYGAEMKCTVYKISHHGAQNLANKKITCHAHAPKAIFVSGSALSSYRHPRCDIINNFVDEVKTLCRPLETNTASAFYCGVHTGGTNAQKLQSTYTCGPTSAGYTTVTGNTLAIYTTMPEVNTMNMIQFNTDGSRWGFVNNFSPRVMNNFEDNPVDNI